MRNFQLFVLSFIIQEMRIIFIYIAILFSAVSCHKDTTNVCTGAYKPYQVINIHHSINSYQFKGSSYWVYQNDATNQIDSQWVAYAGNTDSLGEYPSKCSGGTFVHEYHIRVQRSLTGQHFDYSIIGATLYQDTTSSPYQNHAGKYIFNSMNTSHPESGYEQLEIIPSLTLNGNTIQNVKKIRIKHLDPTSSVPYPYNLSYHDLHYYFADSIGLVKWEVIDGSTVLESWSIKSWEVVL
jgi:hypothetical protein